MSRKDINFIKSGSNLYGIRVLGRGNNLFFRENEKGLVCEIDAEHGVIYKKSIKEWETSGEKMSKQERERVVELIIKFYKEIYNENAVLR